MSRTDSRMTIRELKAALAIVKSRGNGNAERDRKNWGTFASHKTVRVFKRADRRRVRHQGKRQTAREIVMQ
jgi:hypothetical protein